MSTKIYASQEWVSNLYKNCNKFVIDYSLPVKISTADMPVFDKTLASGTAIYGTVEVLDSQTFVYTPTTVLLGIETVVLTFEDNSTYEVYIYPADNMYYDASFATYTNKDETAPWTFEGEAINDYQKTSQLGSGDLYGYDDAYHSGVGTWATSSMAGDNATITFTGTDIDIYANCTSSSGLYNILIKDSAGAFKKMFQVATAMTYDSTQYNLPIASTTLNTYDTYTVIITHTGANPAAPIYFSGFRVYNILQETDVYSDDNQNGAAYFHLGDNLRTSDDDTAMTKTSVIRMVNSDNGFVREKLQVSHLDLKPNTAVAFEINKTGANPRIYARLKANSTATSISYVNSFDTNSKMVTYEEIDVQPMFGMFYEIGTVSKDGKCYVILKNTNEVNITDIDIIRLFDCELVTQADEAGINELVAFTAEVLNKIEAGSSVDLPTSDGKVDLSNYYTKSEVDAALGAYITDIDTLLGGDS